MLTFQRKHCFWKIHDYEYCDGDGNGDANDICYQVACLLFPPGDVETGSGGGSTRTLTTVSLRTTNNSASCLSSKHSLNLKRTAKRRALKELSINFFASFSTSSFLQELLQVTYFEAHISKGYIPFLFLVQIIKTIPSVNLAVQVAVQGETKSLGGSSGQLSNTAVAVSPFSSSNVRGA